MKRSTHEIPGQSTQEHEPLQTFVVGNLGEQ